jgi:hypothetical protein
VALAVIRVVHFIGAENLFHLMVGTCHRPVRQALEMRKTLYFVPC